MVSATFSHIAFGQTIEVNLLGDIKICNFDCTYCSLGPSEVRLSRLKQDIKFPDKFNILAEIGKSLNSAAQSGKAIETILLSGNGEPTLFPDFLELAKDLIARRDELSSSTNSRGKKTKIVCMTNGDSLDDRNIVEALNLFDEVIVKLDVGTEKSFKKLNRPISRSSLEKIILGARSLKNLSVQTALVGDAGGLTDIGPLDDWIEVVAMLNPRRVLLYRAKHPNADPATILATEDQLNVLSHWLERRLKIKALVETDLAA